MNAVVVNQVSSSLWPRLGPAGELRSFWISQYSDVCAAVTAKPQVFHYMLLQTIVGQLCPNSALLISWFFFFFLFFHEAHQHTEAAGSKAFQEALLGCLEHGNLCLAPRISCVHLPELPGLIPTRATHCSKESCLNARLPLHRRGPIICAAARKPEYRANSPIWLNCYSDRHTVFPCCSPRIFRDTLVSKARTSANQRTRWWLEKSSS